MSLLVPQRPSERCLSALALDQLLTGELPPAREEETKAHLASCETCALRWREVHAERQSFAARPMPRLSPRTHGTSADRPRSRRAVAGWAGALAAGLIAIVSLTLRGERRDVTSVKGGAAVDFFRRHAGEVTRLEEGGTVRPGDALQVVTSLLDERHVALLSLDGSGQATMYFPSTPETWPQPAGDGQALPQSTLLDERLGRESLFFLVCEQPRSLHEQLRQLQTHRRFDVPAGCTQTIRTFHKVAEPG